MLKEHDAETSEMPADSIDGTDDVRKNPMRMVYDWTETLCSALALMLVIFMFVFRYVVVDGTSMTNTLAEGDKLLISNVFYPEPKVGDIVVIEVGTVGNKVYDKPLIKRVIATEGQTVDINPETWEIIITEPDGTSYVLDETKYAATINHPDGSDMRTAGTVGNVFDGNLSTIGMITGPQEAGKQILFDLGQEITFNQIRYYINETNLNYIRHAVFDVPAVLTQDPVPVKDIALAQTHFHVSASDAAYSASISASLL